VVNASFASSVGASSRARSALQRRRTQRKASTINEESWPRAWQRRTRSSTTTITASTGLQWLNEVRFDLKYDLIAPGSGESWGPVKTLRFNMLYRGRFDPVYLIRDSYQRRDYDRGDFEFPEGKTPRELFFDIGFNGALHDLSLRIGKQQVVWGEADLFRSLDVVNPLDIRHNGPSARISPTSANRCGSPRRCTTSAISAAT
jgi:Protein of unknown function (DUF1302)